jgi:hypothetical protein
MKGKEGVLITNAARIVERVTGTHRNTICRLLIEVGGVARSSWRNK